MASTPTDTKQETPMQGDSYAFPFTGNVVVPLMATLNLPGFTLGLSVWIFSTPNVPDYLGSLQESTLYQGHQNIVSPSPVATSPPPSTSYDEISDTSNP